MGDQMAEVLERRILAGELQPGVRLPTEQELCQTFSVSRSVVRDALKTLAAKGLIRVRQGVGTVVAEPTGGQLAEALLTAFMRSGLSVGDVIDARAAIETELSRLAVRNGTPRDWSTMEEFLTGFATAVRKREWRSAHRNHLEFHLALLRAIHLPALEILLKPLQQIIVLSSLPPRLDDPNLWDVDAHAPILAALRSGDEAAAYASVQAHFRYMERSEYADFRSGMFSDLVELETYRQLFS
jgi:DNA-binding FadR family transcriptional regulator